jgi:YVTN family beta-propeller protein
MRTPLQHLAKNLSLAIAASALLFSSCKKDDDTIYPEINSTEGVYVLNEGNFGQSNSEITYYNINRNTADKNFYKKVNGTALGETATDLQRYGSKMYCVVSGMQGAPKSFVDVMNVATGKSIKRISFNSATDGYLPRSIAFYNGKAYVSRYDGKVSRIDTATLNIEADITLTPYLEGLAVANGKLYVANSDYLLSGKNTVSVIDLRTFTKIKDITVTQNPVKVAAAPNGDIYVVSYGNYANVAGNLDRISSITDTKVSTGTVAGVDYGSSMAFSTSKYLVSTTDATTFAPLIKNLDLTNGALTGNFVSDDTKVGILYGLTIDDFSNDVYVADAISYTSAAGKVTCFGSNGRRKFSFETGVLPQHAVFVYNYKN